MNRAPTALLPGGRRPADDSEAATEDTMRRVVVFEHLTRDSVMQAPGRADERSRRCRQLVQTLMRHGLVDECVLLIHPLERE